MGIADFIARANQEKALNVTSAPTKTATVSSYIVSNNRIKSGLDPVEEEHNKGGFFGGLGYAFEKIGLGFMSAIEGIWDYTAGGLAKLFGADDWAEQQFANDWVNYNHADEWFNPDAGWKIVGDVTSGIGTSLPSMAALTAVGFATGGAAVPAMITTFLTAGLSAAGNATKEAYRQTGELGGKEFGYGALAGVTEGTVEAFSDLVLGGVGGQITKAFRGEAAGAAIRSSLGKTIAKSFFSEGLEEVIGEFADPYWKRLTYDPDAENASLQELAYAGLVGGLSGAVMSGFGGAISSVRSTARGTNIVSNGNVESVIDTAQNITAYEEQNHTEYEAFGAVKETLAELQESMKKTGGAVQTLKQRMLLGQLDRANTAAVFQPLISRSAENIYANAEAVAERINAYGYTDANGKAINITAEQLRAGIDTSSTKALRRTMAEALKTNSALRTLAVLDATGQLMLDTQKFKEATLMGQSLSSQVDLNNFIEQASEAEKSAVAEKLGISDWGAITNEEFQSKIEEFAQDGGVEEYRAESSFVRDLQNISPDSAKKLPRTLKMADGTTRYRLGGEDIAITKKGEDYRVYDYTSGKLSKSLTQAEINSLVSEMHKAQRTAARQQAAAAQMTEKSAAQEQTAPQTEAQSAVEGRSEGQSHEQSIDAYARENIKDYGKLGASNQSMIRAIIRKGRAAGVEESFLLSCARVSAKSGLNIVFDEKLAFVEKDGTYADGAIDLENNRIIINPNAKSRSGEKVLIHELTHAIYNLSDGTLQAAEGLEFMSAEEKENIRKRYSAVYKGDSVKISDEINAHYAEETLTNNNILEKLVAEKPTVKERILSFFKKSKASYAEDAQLSGAAEKLFKQYKKLFDSFSERNFGTNAHGTGQITVQKQTKRKAASEQAAVDSIQYALMSEKSFTENVKDIVEMSDARAIRNKNLGTFISVMKETPAVITENVADAENLEMIIRFDALYLAARKDGVLKGHYHNLGAEIVSNLPEYLASPDAIVRLDNGRLNLLTRVETEKGNNGIISVELSAVQDINSKYNKYNLIVSLFGTKDNYIKNLLSRDGTQLEYMRKDLSQVNPQLHEWLSIINERSYTNSIAENSGKSTTSGKKNGGKRYALDMSKKQGKTSAATSINSAKLPAVFSRVQFESGTVNLDIGGGKFDNATQFLATKGVTNYIYDPYNRSEAHNKAAARATENGQSDTVTISNVLNVIDTLEGRQQVLENAVDAVKPDGTVYITVYEGNGSGVAKTTGSDQFQLNRKLRDYIPEVSKYFEDVSVKNGVIVAKSPIKTQSSTQSDLDLLFDEEFYKQFENEDRTPIKESLEDLEAERKSPDFDSRPFEETYDICAKIRALKAGYKSLYDYYVGSRKEMLMEDYQFAIRSGRETTATRTIQEKKAKLEKQKKLSADIAEATPHQNAQFDIIQRTNPMFNDTSVGIRSPKEIRTFAEVINDGESFAWGDFSKEDAMKALKRGSVRVYSSYPIKNGVFVSTSYIQALQYAGNDPSGVHSRTVALDSVAWINGDEGQYAKVYKTNSDTRYALPQDAEYMAAAQNGDTQTAQKLVDEAAKKAGYTARAYHGTLAKSFNEFSKDLIGTRWSFDEKGFFFIDRKSIAEDYARSEFDSTKRGRVLDVYLKTEKPLLVDKRYVLKEGLGNVFRDDDAIGVWDSYNSFFLEEAEKRGADSIILDDGMSKMYVVFEPNQVKSAEAITRDDSGKIVPLSERFNERKNDMRYALPAKDSEGQTLSAAQREFFRNSEVRDGQGRLLVVYHGTTSGQFTVFEHGKGKRNDAGWLGEGFYFYGDKQEAYQYTHGSGRVIEAYLNVKNPYYATDQDMERLAELDDVKESRKFTEKLKADGYDGVYYNGDLRLEWVVFEPNQIKLTSNQKPSLNADMRYALPETDSAGKKLSGEQRRYFNDSKIVDEQGRLLPVYHGSPKAGFTVFNTELEGSYFTANKEYAQAYARGDKNKVYAVYLNITKPFDTRDSAARRIFEKEFYGKWGNGAPLTERGLLDWTDGADMYDFLQEKGYDYDGIIIDEGGVPDGRGGVANRGVSYVAFYPNQIKLASNTTPTSDSDIRYALGDIVSKYEKQTDVLSVYEHKDKIAISNIVVKKNLRNKGIGQAILNDIISYADHNNKTITLTPTSEFGTKERLKRWYKKNGFVENKGKNTDFTISDTMYRLPQKSNTANIRYALTDSDSSGRKLSAQQRQFFQNSRAVDAAGNLRVLYHQTSAEFTVFDTTRKGAGTSDNQMPHGIFMKPTPANIGLKGDTQMELYANITNPLVFNNREQAQRYWRREIDGYAEITDELRDNDERYNAEFEEAFSFERIAKRRGIEWGTIKRGDPIMEDIFEESERETEKILAEWRSANDVLDAKAKSLIDEYLRANGYDGVFLREDRGSMGRVVETLIALDASQVKSTSNTSPTKSNDIRYALPSTDTNDRKLSAKQAEYFMDSKIRDESGRLLVVYHGSKANITQFEESFISKWNRLGSGYYFTSSEERAKRYAKESLFECYLNITNPFVTSEKAHLDLLYKEIGHTRAEVEAFAEKNGYSGSEFFKLANYLDDAGYNVSAYIRRLGFDGIYDSTYSDIEIVAYESNQIKLTSSKTPTTSPDIRFALSEDGEGRGSRFSRGQRAKFAANNTRFRVYSRVEAAEVVNSIIDERLVLGDKYGSLHGKSKAEVIDLLFQKLNNTDEGYRIGVALNIADYIIENAYLTDIYDDGAQMETSEAMARLSVLRKYMHRLDLRGIQGEIQHKFDKKNAVNLVWGTKSGGIAPDIMAQELESYGIFIDAINEADQFFEMLEIYEAARNTVNAKAEELKLTAYGSEAQINRLRQEIARDILAAYDEKGSPSKYSKLVEKYTAKIATLTKEVRESRRRNSLINGIIDNAQYLRDIAQKRKYVGADVFQAPELTSWLKNLGKLKYRSDLRKTGARQILIDYGKFYNTSNPLLYDADPNLSYIDNNVLDAINTIKANETSAKPLSLEELQAAQVILASAKHLFSTYDQITMEGRKVSITEMATQGNEILQHSKNRTGRSVFNTLYGVANKIIEPRAVIRSLESYNPHGVLTRAYAEITKGETQAGLRYIELMTDFDQFLAAHKKYSKRLTSQYITVAGAELNVGQAISLYELSKREQARDGLFEAGFSYMDKKGAKRSVKITESDIAALQRSFTAEDLEFIRTVEDFFNVKSKELKTAADLQILGYTNASNDFYFPIKRDSGTIARNITDARELMSDWANVYNFSFNKDVKTGAKNKLFVTGVYDVVTRHAKQLSTYAELTVPLKNFSQIYAKNIGTKTDVISIKTTLNEQVWSRADDYLSKLFADIQGKSTSNSIIEKLRSAYAKYQLGANLKVIVSQVTSYPTAGIYLDVSSMAKGAVMKTDYAAMDKYCAFARVRNYERGIVRAEGVIDKVGKVGDILTKPIQWTDRATIGKLWNACQVQVQKDSGLKIGTVENMEKAGVLLEEVSRLTQPNYSNSERSELMRSDSDIVRSFTMFTSVPLKQLSRLVESVGEYRALRQMVKSGNADAATQTQYKAAAKKLRRTLGAITIANLMYCLVGQFFKWLYDKDRKDKDGNEISFLRDFFNDFVSTTIGMLPIVKDIYNYFVNDYEFNNFAYETINSVLSSSQELFNLATKAANGEVQSTSDYMKPLRNSLYAIGQITGLPFRNINNTVSGLVKRFDPSAAYKYNSMFYNAQYSSDIKDALEKGDTDLAETIMGLLLNERGASGLSTAARQKYIDLYSKGYSILPRAVGNSITYNGETIALSSKQRSVFKAIYEQANEYIEKMLESKQFLSLSEDKQAKAIKQIYDAYYDKALASILGVGEDSKILLVSKFISMETLSPILAGISDLSSDKDKAGKAIQGSKKKKVVNYLLGARLNDAERLLLLCYSGYTVSDKDYRNMSALKARRLLAQYISRLNVTKEEKTQLAEMCGLTVRNGKIYFNK